MAPGGCSDHFTEWKELYFDPNCSEICCQESNNNKAALVQKIAWYELIGPWKISMSF